MKVSIIGGGVAGCATAYYLSKDGHDVTLFERDSLASHASGFALGGINPLIRGVRQPEYEVFSDYSIGLHRDLVGELTGDGPGIEHMNFVRKGSMLLVTDEPEAEEMRRIYRRHADDYSLDMRWLSPGEFSHIEARISDAVIGGLYVGEMFEVDPYRFTLSLWQAAEQFGAQMLNREVTEIAVSGDRVTGVIAGGEVVDADVVVAAAGPWSAELLAGVGVEVPISPLKGQIVRLNAPDPPIKVSLSWDHNYATTKADGLTWIGTTEEEVGFDDRTTDEARDEIIGAAVRVLPYLEDAELVQQTACLRPMTPDRMPIIDSEPGPDGLVISTGGGRQGIALGPAFGIATAALVTGLESPVDISGFSLSRFS
jgi:glycine/D-amino acid oxidase-like deaminating enzyme